MIIFIEMSIAIVGESNSGVRIGISKIGGKDEFCIGYSSSKRQ